MAARFIPRCSQKRANPSFGNISTGREVYVVAGWRENGETKAMKRFRRLYEEGDTLGNRPLAGEGTNMTEKGFARSPSTSAAAASSADLVARARRGEEAAFEELFESHKRRVYSLCLRMTRNSADAEDLTQQAFLQVFRKIANFRGESKFSTWLHRLAVNEVLMHLRRQRPAPVPFDETDASQEGPVPRQFLDNDRRLMGTVDRTDLERAIAKLSPGYRTAFVLFDLEGYEHHEIAPMMNWSVGNSKSQLHKARRKLRDWLCLHGGKESSANRTKVVSGYEAKKSSALRDRARARGMNRLAPGILTR
jgi:RNA polymerase sigma-70 factor, ECF subfamily